MQKNQARYKEDEIDLKELFKTIFAYKKFIATFTLSIIFLALVYILIKTPIYQVKSNVQIGYIGEDLLDIPETIVKKLNIIFDVDGKLEKKNKEFISKVSSISQNKKLKNFIEVVTDGISNEEALKKNKKVITYLQQEYESKIKLYKMNTNNAIKDKLHQIANIKNLDAKNIQEEIKKIKNIQIAKIDNDIKILKTQDIKKLENEKAILQKQDIPKLKTQIDFLKTIKLVSINNKIDFHTKKLSQYQKSISEIYNNAKSSQDTIITSISTMQMLNYQNLVLNSQNKIEDLKSEKKKIELETIPQLQNKIKNTTTVSIKNIDNEINNIKNIKIVNLQKQKENIINETIRQLNYKLTVTLPNTEQTLQQDIDKLKYNISALNLQNSKVVGEFIVKDSPFKPKKILILAIAFMAGSILSLFLVFFMEFTKSFKNEEKS